MPGWLRCKLMCDLGRRGPGAHTRQLETGAAPREPNEISVLVNFSLLYPGRCNHFAKGCSYCGKRARSRKGNPEGPPSQAVPALGPEPGRLLAAWQVGSIPVSLLQGNSRSAWRDGGKEEGTGSRGDRPVGAAWLLSMGGTYHCHRLGLITGTCLQPRQLPAGIITSSWAGL